jgi:hypothetical protein
VKKPINMKNARRRLFVVLTFILASFVVTNCCTTFLIPGTGGRPVETGTIDQYGNPTPAGAICASGNKCADPGKSCGLFSYKQVCTNVWNSETQECSCKCK